MARRPETWALVLLTIGAYAGPLAWLAGWVLVGRSRRWNAGHKIVAALLPVVMLVGLVPIVFIVGQVTCDGDCNHALPPIALAPLLVLVVLALAGMLPRLVRAARA